MFKNFPTDSIIAIILLLLIAVLPIYAGTTGKISGVVKDKETGEALPGVNVIIEGTSMGAASDINGNYFMINVPPGKYTVMASMMGYQPMRIVDLVVQMDRTIEANFDLNSAVLDLGETVSVVANRELVRKDVSYSQTNITGSSIDEIPAAFKLDNSLVTQAGIQDEGHGIIIRRGSSQEISYFLMDFC